MEAMAAAEQAIELATATASAATAVAPPSTAEASPTTATQPSVAAATAPSDFQLSSKQQNAVASANSSASELQMAEATQHAKHGHMDPLQEALHNHLQRQSQASVQQHDGEDEAQPLIAAPQGLLQVSIDQRPAKKYFDRSASFHPLLDASVTTPRSPELANTNMVLTASSCSWAAQYNTWLLVPKRRNVFFSFPSTACMVTGLSSAHSLLPTNLLHAAQTLFPTIRTSAICWEWRCIYLSATSSSFNSSWFCTVGWEWRCTYLSAPSSSFNSSLSRPEGLTASSGSGARFSCCGQS